jgi:hypothetical protein
VNDTSLGLALVGIGILAVLVLVFVLSSRGGPRADAGHPPRGVHMPAPSLLPVLFSFSAAVIGIGLVFAPEGSVANWFIFVPGLVLLVASVWAWVRAAGHEWHDVERRPGDDSAGH